MVFFRRAASLPLGVDLASDAISIVAADTCGDGFAIRRTLTTAVPAREAGDADRAISETLRALVSTLQTRERRCVLAVPAGDVVVRTFRLPPGMKKREASRAAALEADSIVDWPLSERLVALDPLPARPEEMLFSIARASSVGRLVSIVRASGLRPVAVDVPACAWRRAVPGADALLDCTRERAMLIVFGDPVGVTLLFPPRLIDERLASHVRAAFADARRDGRADVRQLAIFGSRNRYASLEEHLRGDGYSVAPLVLGGSESPSWAFAYALSSWSVCDRGLEAA